MRFEDIKFQDLYVDRKGYGDYNATSKDLYDWLNEKRKGYGYTDLVGTDYMDNDVYYDFYLQFDTDKKKLTLVGKCNYGEKDDEVWYEVELTDEEREMLLWKLIAELSWEQQ